MTQPASQQHGYGGASAPLPKAALNSAPIRQATDISKENVFSDASFDQEPVAIEQIMRRADTWRGQDIGPVAIDGLATGYTQLDQALHGGGWPLGQTIELLSDSNGLGAMGLFLPAMEALTEKNRWQVFIAPPHMPYAPLLAARGIDTQQILLVHPQNRQDLLWSIEQALRSTTCSAVFAWLGADEYRYSELRKLQLAAADSDALSVLFRPRKAAHNHAPASLRLEINGYRQAHILKQRGGNQHVDVRLSEEDDIPGQPQMWELPAYPAGQATPPSALGA
ncbi:MAG: translesion DNA synthesis-associated protein ImuA [Pseudomonadota bacterium]